MDTRVIRSKSSPVNLVMAVPLAVNKLTDRQTILAAPKIVKWGKNNKLPIEILTLLQESGTARRCWLRTVRFVKADGFTTPEASNYAVNPYYTADTLLSKIVPDLTYTGGFALRVLYSLDAKKTEIYHVPIKTVRKLEDGRFIVNPKMGLPGFKEDENEILEAYNPDPVFIKEKFKEEYDRVEGDVTKMKQAGQLLLVHSELPDNDIYPKPDFWTTTGVKDIKSDVEISITDNDNLNNNFTPPVIIFVPGQFNDKQKDEHGKTQVDYLEEKIETLTDKENRSQAVLLTGQTKEQAPILTAWNNEKQLLALDTKRENIANAICRHFAVPPILIGLYKAGALSQSKEIINSIALFHLEVLDYQGLIQRAFERLFKVDTNQEDISNFWVISTLSVLNELPDFVLDSLTSDEKRKIAGYPELEKPEINANTQTINALAALPALVANRVLEEMTSEEIRGLIGLKGEKKKEDVD